MSSNMSEEQLSNIDTKWTPPEGTFTKSAKEIAQVLYDNSKDLKQAMARLNFYINRGGDDVPNKDNLEKAKDELRKLYEVNMSDSLTPAQFIANYISRVENFNKNRGDSGGDYCLYKDGVLISESNFKKEPTLVGAYNRALSKGDIPRTRNIYRSNSDDSDLRSQGYEIKLKNQLPPDSQLKTEISRRKSSKSEKSSPKQLEFQFSNQLKIMNKYTKIIAEKAKQINFAIKGESETDSKADDLKRQVLASIRDYIKEETGKDVFLKEDDFDKLFGDLIKSAKEGELNKEVDSGKAPTDFCNK